MKTKLSGDTLIIRGEKGEEISDIIKKACEKHNVKAGFVTALGATDNVTLGVFDPKTKIYNKKTHKGTYEILNLTGNISTKNKETYTHLHITISGENNKAIGGHLNEANISLTFEAFVKIIDTTIERKFDEDLGINLMIL